MRRWALLLVMFATPLSSPLACGGDHCLRTSDCHADEICSAGECVLEHAPGTGGEGGEASPAPATAGTTSVAGSGGTTPVASGGDGDGGEVSALPGGGSTPRAGSGGSAKGSGGKPASEAGAAGNEQLGTSGGGDAGARALPESLSGGSPGLDDGSGVSWGGAL